MKRILFDVPKWSVFLHRQSRGLDPPELDDIGRRQLEDELFERLYAGGVEELAESQKDRTLRAWAEEVHTACDQMPSFARLQAECRGDPGAAAAAVEALMAELEPLMAQMPAPERLRRAIRAACASATSMIEVWHEQAEGLEQVRFGLFPGTGSASGAVQTYTNVRALAQRLRNDHRLQRIALLAGRFKRIAAKKQRQKIKHGTDEIADVEQGGDLGRLLPAELAKLVHPRLRLAALRDLAERQSLQYQLRGIETLGKGPIVVCLDKSGSMDGRPDEWATAVALALLEVARSQRRPYALLGFDGAVKYEAFVEAGDLLPESGLFTSCGGGTDIDRVISRALAIIAEHPGRLKRADVVLITDGESDSATAPVLRERAAALGVTILGFGIGVAPASLAPWCDEAHAIADLNGIDDQTAETLFGQ